MTEILKSRLNGLGNRAYIYGIDLISFVKSLKKKSVENADTANIAVFAQKFSDLLIDIEDTETYDKIIADLKKSNTFANQILGFLQNIKCEKELLNEKTDLILKTYDLIQEVEDIIKMK